MTWPARSRRAAAPPGPDLSPDVAQALADGAPVVALESTLISHGMPWPRNLETALALEADLRAHGAVPATIAIIDGRLCAGLAPAQIERLARAGPAVAKASRRDIPLLVAGCGINPANAQAQGLGATTVAATMIIAALAGIRVFATGGIGGVHRGAESSFDISADLQELARSEVAVVCAGPKSILDLGLTLEYLETHGVPVIGFGTDRLPAFYSRDSGFGVNCRIDDPAQVAAVMQAQWSLGLGGGLLVANPIPEAVALPREVVDAAISQALADAAASSISGKALTPYLLQRVNELTGGHSLAANIALVRNNARLAAALAVAWAALPA